MKSRHNDPVCATVFAALTIVACSLSSMLSCHRRRRSQREALRQAVQHWEDEGGAIIPDRDEAETLTSYSR